MVANQKVFFDPVEEQAGSNVGLEAQNLRAFAQSVQRRGDVVQVFVSSLAAPLFQGVLLDLAEIGERPLR